MQPAAKLWCGDEREKWGDEWTIGRFWQEVQVESFFRQHCCISKTKYGSARPCVWNNTSWNIFSFCTITKFSFFTASKCLTATISANTDNTADMPVRGAPHLTTCRPGCSRTSWVSQSSSIDRYEQRQNPEPQNLTRKDITGDVEKSVSILFDLLSPPSSGKPATASHDSPSHDTGLRSAALDTEYKICSGPRLKAITQKTSQ